MKRLPVFLAVALFASTAVAASAQTDSAHLATMAVTTEGSVHTAAGPVLLTHLRGRRP